MHLSQVFDGSSFSVSAAVDALISRGDVGDTERRIIAEGLFAWMLAPNDPDFISLRLLRGATLALTELEDPSIMNSLMGKDRLLTITEEEAKYFARTDSANGWVVEAFEFLGGDRRLRTLAFDESIERGVEDQWKRALRVAELLHVVHYHAAVLAKAKEGFAPVGVERARQLISMRSKKTSIHVSTSSLHRTYWLPLKASATWLYALLYKPAGPRSSPRLHTLGTSRIVDALQMNCKIVAGRCKFIEETVLPKMLYVSVEHRPNRTEFYRDVPSIPFEPDPLHLTDIELDLFRDRRIKHPM